jgi:hypothetical protein
LNNDNCVLLVGLDDLVADVTLAVIHCYVWLLLPVVWLTVQGLMLTGDQSFYFQLLLMFETIQTFNVYTF